MLTNVRLCIGLSTGGKIRYGDLITALSLAESATLTELSAHISVGMVGNPHFKRSKASGFTTRGRVVADPELTPVFLFRGYFWIEGHSPAIANVE
jgi:hypothetical protein